MTVSTIGDDQSRKRFERFVRVVLENEVGGFPDGGYTNDPDDPGGETKYGITKRWYPNVDIANLTEEKAIEIYWNDWWLGYRYDRIKHDEIALKAFDLAVVAGPGDSHRALQRAVHATGHRHVTVDGIIGPQTVNAVNASDPRILLGAYRIEAKYMFEAKVRQNPNLKKFLKGWLEKRAFS